MTRAEYLVHLSYQKEIIMNKTWLKRLGAASGVLYVVLAIVGSSGSGSGNGPLFHATQQEVIAWAKSVQLTPNILDRPLRGVARVTFLSGVRCLSLERPE